MRRVFEVAPSNSTPDELSQGVGFGGTSLVNILGFRVRV